MGQRHAFVANSHGNLVLLERMLVSLVQSDVHHIHAVDSCAYDVQAVLRAREERFPEPVTPGAKGFEDYVLASVLSGVVEAPADEVALNGQLRDRVVLHTQPDLVDVEGYTVAVGDEDPNGVDLIVRHKGVRRLDVGRAVPRLDPGHVRAEMQNGEPATCAVLEDRERGLTVRFVTVDGAVIEGPRQAVPRR